MPYSFDKQTYHIVLESINFVRDGVFCVMIIIFTFPEKKEEYFLGRGHEATFKISDISISRVHAKFYLKDENIVIDDLGSKFGTLLLVRKNINVTEMIEKKMNDSTSGVYTADLSFRDDTTIDEEGMMQYIKSKLWGDKGSMHCPYIKTVEVIDWDALEKAIYTGEITKKQVLAMDKFKSVKKTPVLKLKVAKEG